MVNSMQATAVCLFGISSVLGRVMFYFLHYRTLFGFVTALFVGSLMVVCIGTGAIYLFLASQRVSEHHTVFSALFHFIVTYYVTHIGKTHLSQFRKSFPNPRQTQEIRLKEILIRNKDTAYGVEFNLGKINCLRDFKKKHPLTTYDHYEPFVQRVAEGEKKVMTNEPVTRLVLTSGTTGKGKRIPRHTKELTNYLGVISAIYLECFPQVQPMQKTFRLHCNTKLVKSEGGIPVAAGMVVEQNTARFMAMFSTPPEGFMIESINEAFYVHFLFALRERRLGSAMAVFSSMFVDAFKFFEKHWPEMVNDLANGTINKNLNLPFNIRESLENAIGSGDVQRAEEVRRECEKGQQGIMKRLWPMMEYVAVIDNVGIRSTLMKTIGEGLYFHAPFYAPSEAVIGVNFNPRNKACDEFVLAVTDSIFEFIPENNIDQPEPETYLIDEVEVGKNYEMVVSQLWGLYRYRFGDVVQVTGYYENTPKVKFLYRTATLLNLFGEKVDQPVFVNSLRTALSHWPEVEMAHYCVAESTMLTGMPEYNDNTSRGAHYVIFLEMKPTEKESSWLRVDTAELAKEIDDNIYKGHSFYRKFKDTQQIHESEVYLVKPGSFNELKEFILSNTSATEVQFKMPQKLRTKEMAKIMLLNRIQ